MIVALAEILPYIISNKDGKVLGEIYNYKGHGLESI